MPPPKRNIGETEKKNKNFDGLFDNCQNFCSLFMPWALFGPTICDSGFSAAQAMQFLFIQP